MSIQPKYPPRNSLCRCGSGQKYKHCCGAIDQPKTAVTADDWLANARAAINRGQLLSAEHCFRQALLTIPRNAEALAGLGQCLCWQDQMKEGLLLLKQAGIELQQTVANSERVAALINLSTQLLHWGDLDTAVEFAVLAAQWEPDNAAALNNLALCFSRTNRDKEALPYAYLACELLPDHPGCNILLAILETRQKKFSNAQKRLEHILLTCQDQEQSARAQLELGVVFDKTGCYEQAFAAFTHAGAKQARLPAIQAIDAESIFTAIAENRAGFTPALLSRWPSAQLSEDKLPTPVFLFGFLRSGTTLTEQVLAAHPDIITSNEEPFIAALITELQRLVPTATTIPARLQQLTLEELRQLRRFYWQRVTEKYSNRVTTHCFIDKMALNSVEAGLISCIFPEAKILFALRDPRDVCLSCFMQAFNPSPATINLLSWNSIARQYAAVMDYWLTIRESLAPQVLELRYEDTVNDFETTYRNVFAFLGVSWNPDCAAFHTTVPGRYIATPSFSAVGQPLYKTAVGRWQHYAPFFEPILPQLQRFIDSFGYAN